MIFNLVFKKYWLKFSFTFFLLLIEAGVTILFPLFIGYAIDDAVNLNYNGAIKLGALSLLALFVGVGRRIFDSRFYAIIYQNLGCKSISKMEDNLSSTKSARLGMIGEFIEFLENSLPELIQNIVGLAGIIIIIFTLNISVFNGCLVATSIIFLIYRVTSKKTIFLNKSLNDEMETQVDILSKNSEKELAIHLQKMMKWNIRLSDLEAINFSVSWIVLSAFLVASIVWSTNYNTVKYGAILSLVMYVFQYIENVINLPLFYQNWLRLEEIKTRINNT